MNTKLLNQYNVSFRITYNEVMNKNLAKLHLEQNDTLGLFLYLLFEQGTRDGHLKEILKTITKAENNQPFDPTDDGAPESISLHIGKNITILERIYHLDTMQIPTNDLKGIILCWFEFLTKNKLENSVW